MPHPIIAVAMSGGVDSSTVAALLLAEGRRLIGFTMQVWDPRRLPELAAGTRASRVRSGDNIEQARQVARRLGIAHHVVKLQDSFERLVVGPFITEYLKGRTPIPCAVCNRVIQRPVPNASPPGTTPASGATRPRADTSCSGELTRPKTRATFCLE